MKKLMFMFTVLAAIPLSGSFCGEDTDDSLRPPPEVSVDVGTAFDADGGARAAIDADLAPIDAPDAAHTFTTDGDTGPAERVYFVTPHEGEVVPARALYATIVEGFRLVPSWVPEAPHQGHLHLVVDQPCPLAGERVEETIGEVLELSEGQSEAQLVLTPGAHEVCVVAGDRAHVAFGLTDRVHVQVE